jgi:hypothetical protein
MMFGFAEVGAFVVELLFAEAAAAASLGKINISAMSNTIIRATLNGRFTNVRTLPLTAQDTKILRGII